jgi:hypothetical protein
MLALLVTTLALAADPWQAAGTEVRCDDNGSKKGDMVFLRVQADGGEWQRVPADGEAGHLMLAGGELGAWTVKRPWTFHDTLNVELRLDKGKEGRLITTATVSAADGAQDVVVQGTKPGAYTLTLHIGLTERAQHEATNAAWQASLHQPEAVRLGNDASNWTVIRRELTTSWASSPLVDEVTKLVSDLRDERLHADEAGVAALDARQVDLRARLTKAGISNAVIADALRRIDQGAPGQP